MATRDAPGGFAGGQETLPPPVTGGHGRSAHPNSSFNWHVRVPLRATRKTAIKNHFVAAVGEFVGTTLFLFFALGGTNVANIPSVSITNDVNTSQLLYISLCFGFSLAVNAWVFFRISGGLFNPAVSWGLALVGAITPIRACVLTVAQILGGITGAAIIQAVLPGSLNVRTTLAGGTSVAQGLFLEMFLTSMLMVTIFLLAAEKHKATFLAPIGIGLALFIAELVGVFYTGGSLNPARSFGPDVVLKEFASYHWIYWLGPFLGATLAAGFYKFIKYMQYETVTPDQDAAEDHAMLATDKVRKVKMSEKDGSGGVTPVAKPPMSRRSTRLTLDPNDPSLVATQGPGIGDLLTVPVTGTAVYELANNEHHQQDDRRLDELEHKLDLIIATLQSSHHNAAHSPTGANRVSFSRDAISTDPGLGEHMHADTDNANHELPTGREQYGDHGRDILQLGSRVN